MCRYDDVGSRASDDQLSLCIAFENGFVQLGRTEEDLEPLIFDCEMRITHCKWNADGTSLAISGVQTAARGEQSKQVNLIKFYDHKGTYLRNIRIPGEEISALSWEGSGLRIALAVDAFIFFANIRPSYCWAYVENTVVYSYFKVR